MTFFREASGSLQGEKNMLCKCKVREKRKLIGNSFGKAKAGEGWHLMGGGADQGHPGFKRVNKNHRGGNRALSKGRRRIGTLGIRKSETPGDF